MIVELASQTEDWWTLVHATWEFGELHHIRKDVVIWRVPIGDCSEATGLSLESIRFCIQRFQEESRRYDYMEGYPHCTQLQIRQFTTWAMCPECDVVRQYAFEYVQSSKNLPQLYEAQRDGHC